MKVLILVITVIFIKTEAWIGVIEFSGNYTSHCYAEQYNIGSMEENETRRIQGLCAEAVCQKDRSIKLTGCAPMMVKPPCYMVDGNISKPFPTCCYEIRCDKSS
ncbi:hypothetical protein Zmor_006276 [Zophobas morio]|uniref:Single domain-containing protein n=1 Tax=Zophobas morio TaxID=2755281 RepID=A0AA38ITI2_9CUCU|nr:hypothetical protein Zmor_006276 [Zophobas morio]